MSDLPFFKSTSTAIYPSSWILRGHDNTQLPKPKNWAELGGSTPSIWPIRLTHNAAGRSEGHVIHWAKVNDYLLIRFSVRSGHSGCQVHSSATDPGEHSRVHHTLPVGGLGLSLSNSSRLLFPDQSSRWKAIGIRLCPKATSKLGVGIMDFVV